MICRFFYYIKYKRGVSKLLFFYAHNHIRKIDSRAQYATTPFLQQPFARKQRKITFQLCKCDCSCTNIYWISIASCRGFFILHKITIFSWAFVFSLSQLHNFACSSIDSRVFHAARSHKSTKIKFSKQTFVRKRERSNSKANFCAKARKKQLQSKLLCKRKKQLQSVL